ncbi:hypothetical protein [Flavobacterium sp. W21_SRS_FM6]|uniref:hypothetical protein n=1 Tax=Flavobacterium sp. W21_SRS_FM6 TaxID=3240268 RepID=UPI003F8F90A5
MGNTSYQQATNAQVDAAEHLHRVLVSLCRELAATDDNTLGPLTDNIDDLKAHAAILCEWLKRQDASFDNLLIDGLMMYQEEA